MPNPARISHTTARARLASITRDADAIAGLDRVRDIAHLVEEFDGHLTKPECLSQQRLHRIEAAGQAGSCEGFRPALEESSLDDPQTQWQLLLPILTEAEQPPSDAPKPRPGRPPEF